MTHPNHRDHKDAIRAKRMHEDLDDEEAATIEYLLAADQRQEHDRPPYRESAQPDERGQDGGRA